MCCYKKVIAEYPIDIIEFEFLHKYLQIFRSANDCGECDSFSRDQSVHTYNASTRMYDG